MMLSLKSLLRVTSRCLWGMPLMVLLLAPCAFASGWNDYSFDLPGGYMVLRANAQDIHIWRTDGDGTLDPVTDQNGTGLLRAVALQDGFIYAKNGGARDADPVTMDAPSWTIIDSTRQIVHGPFSISEFDAKRAELGLKDPIPWMSVDDAYRQALREGRADKAQVDVALVGTAVFLGFTWVFFSPAFALVAALAAFAVRRAKNWSYPRSFFVAFAAVFFGSFGCVLVLCLYRWVSMRFL